MGAYLPNGENGREWAIQNLGDEVFVIENPGLPTERVHFKYNGRNSREIVVVKEKILASDVLSEVQKFYIGFWMGYFYAYLGTSNPPGR